jgi:hypothetical protein
VLETQGASDPDWVAVYVHLRGQAEWRSPGKHVRWNGLTLELKPGQLLTCASAIARNTGVHPRKVARILTDMQYVDLIVMATTNLNSLITITKWDLKQESVKPTDNPT